MAFILAPESAMLNGNGLHINGQDSLIQPLLNDYYQFTMCYGYWKAGTHDDRATFDLFFRKPPFHGEYTIFAGLDDCLQFVKNFRFSDSDLECLRSVLPPTTSAGFFDFLKKLDCSQIRISAIPEGTVVFPRVPLITLDGPLAVCQLLETTFLNLVNYASLVATNAARFRMAAGEDKELLEFGLRRAQGPNGGLTASKYSYMGGFDRTSNMLAHKLFKIPVAGTQAHSFVSSFDRGADLHDLYICPKDEPDGVPKNIYKEAKKKIDWLMANMEWGVSKEEVSDGELAAFCAYAIAFPDDFVALVDTYDTLRSGLVNFCAVSLVLFELGYIPQGCRIDSGDLSFLSKEARRRFRTIAGLNKKLAWMVKLKIVASNDINEETIISLNAQGHEIDSYGVGTHLVTCQRQPALGCVYKLVAVNGQPKIKLSEDVKKITIPGKKKVFRLYEQTEKCILDLMLLETEPDPVANEEILCRHPFDEAKRAKVTPAKVERLQLTFWENGAIQQPLPTLKQRKEHVVSSLGRLRQDHLRWLNPTPYKISVSDALYEYFHTIWLQNAPIGRLP